MSRNTGIWFAALFAFTLMVPASAAAWTFDADECSPPTETDLSRQTPNIFLMVDHSGSMNDVAQARTCHVCSMGGSNYKVDSVGECVLDSGWTVNGRGLPGVGDTANGYDYSFTINLAADQRGDATLSLELFGDFYDSCTGATIYIDGDRVGTLSPPRRGNGPSCGSRSGLRGTFDVSARQIRDGQVTVTVDTQGAYRTRFNSCGGVDRCSTRGQDRAVFTLSRPSTTYEGYIQDSVCGEETKWEQAYFGLKSLVTDSDAADPQYARFGYGTFESGTSRELTCGLSHGDDIADALDDRTETCGDSYCVTDWGSTAIPDAIDTSYGSSCFDATSPPRPSAVILLTDGNPTVRYGSTGCGRNDNDCYEIAAFESVREACRHRDEAPMFMVGLGSGTDEELNDMIATASGTGTCLDGALNEVDPCDYLVAWDAADENWRSSLGWSCEGSFQVDDGDQLVDALQSITAKLACTFGIDFLRSGQTSVPEDPTNDYEYLSVDLFDGSTSNRVYHADSSLASPSGEGWTFTSEERRFVEFTDYYCDEIAVGSYTKGTTQLACLCQEDTGTRCDVPNYEELRVCPEGTWICLEGTDICEPDANCCTPGEACDTGLPGICGPGTMVCDGGLGTCVQNEQPTDEVCDLLDNDCDGETDEGLDGDTCTIDGAVGRCAEGRTRCTAGELFCDALGAQPELCNGLDDDCDGMVDNMHNSWQKPEYSAMKPGLSDDGQAAACGFNDVCACPNGPAELSTANNFNQFLDDWSPVCLCGEGLEANNEAPPADEAKPMPAVGCSMTDAGNGSLALLALGLLAFRRRR